MRKVDEEEQTSANYQGDDKPKYKEPKIKYRSYSDYSNEGPSDPVYNNRGYSEYR
jgi:hypothetical protein